MSKRLRSTLILLASLMAAPLHTIAPPAMAAAVIDDQGTDDDGLDETIRRELALFRAAPVSLSDAMRIAERLHAGAKVADVSFDGAAKGSPVYRIRTVQDDQVWEHAIDARTGDIAEAEVAMSLQVLNAEDRNNFVALNAVRQPLSDAVRVAEQATSGKAISGGLMSERGRLNFVIIVVSGADLKQVVLEPPKAKHR